MTKQVFQTTFAGRELIVETGQVAKQANGSVVVRYGESTVLTAAVMSKKMATGDFFPLQVNYEEKMYAAGKFPGGFMKREGRPSTDATLTARLIDRPIRPMFAEGFRNEVQVINTVLSYDENASAPMAAMFGSSLALSISDIPFDGPIAGVQVGYVDGEIIINPTQEQAEQSLLELTVAGTKHAINMVESGAKELSEEIMLEALLKGHEAVKELIAFQEEIVAAVGKEKAEVELLHVDADLQAEIIAAYNSDLQKAVQVEEKLAREAATQAVKDQVTAVYEEKYADHEEFDRIMRDVAEILEQMEHAEVRRLITEDKVRPDGRKVDEIRPLDAVVDFLPRVHGSGLFTRGQTQALSVLTLAPMGETQIIDGLDPEYKKRFMHHYNFPQYSVGETGRYGAPGRREIGHGALGERALAQVLPSLEEFPYAIRLVAEVLESNGSSSQASICAGTLALMAGGVPIKAPVAGIAMGLISDGNNYTVLTDIQGLEDHFGDMDFKVAGTRDGITALQMDIKIQGITAEILTEALAQAKKARFEILDVIEGLDDRVALLGVLVDDLLVGDDAEPFGGVRQAVHVVAVLVGHLLALLVEQLVGFGVLQRLEVILVLGVLVEAADAEHGRGVVLGQLGRQRGFVAAGSGGLDVDLHAGFLGVHVGEFVPLVDDFRLVVQEVDMACVAVRA